MTLSMQYRSSSGCWTCRLRRKKCDETQPICNVCSNLQISCNYDPSRPAWMNKGAQQDAMAEQVKREIKERNPYRRRNAHQDQIMDKSRAVELANCARGPVDQSQVSSREPDANVGSTLGLVSEMPVAVVSQPFNPSPGTCQNVKRLRPFSQSDSILLMFFLERALPFLMPFYQPNLLLGGRAWILDLAISSPVVRQSTLCQSSFFFALEKGGADYERIWHDALVQAEDAFAVLGEAIQVIKDTGIAGHEQGAVRILAAIVQLQRFEIALTCFDNCRAHLHAALALFQQLFASIETPENKVQNRAAGFNTIMELLNLSQQQQTSQDFQQLLSAEQAAFEFSTALLLFDDIIASTILQRTPILYEYFSPLLHGNDSMKSDPLINLEHTMGCQNWVLLCIAEIAVLDAWKQQCKEVGNLDVMELVRRASPIKTALETQMEKLKSNPVHYSRHRSVLDYVVLSETGIRPDEEVSCYIPLITQVWSHAASLYLSLVVSGWQPASAEVRFHIEQVFELVSNRIAPSTLMRTVAWPLCVTGFLVTDVSQKAQLRRIVDTLHPASMFGCIRRGLNIVEDVWRDRERGIYERFEFASSFRFGGDIVLLI